MLDGGLEPGDSQSAVDYTWEVYIKQAPDPPSQIGFASSYQILLTIGH